MIKLKVGDKVRKILPSIIEGDFGIVGQEYTVLDVTSHQIRIEPNGPLCRADNFELVEEEWSDWEYVVSIFDHSQYHPDCDYISHWQRKKGEMTFKVRIKLPKKPKRVAIKDLTGTVELDAEGKPKFDTYKE